MDLRRLDLTQIAVLVGLLVTLLIVLVTVARQRRFEPKDFYSFIVAFISGCNIPPSIYLCLYVFFPDPPTVQTKLRGHERYISLAGIVLFIASLMALWKLLKEAKAKSSVTPPL